MRWRSIFFSIVLSVLGAGLWAQGLSDSQATAKTKALYSNLKELSAGGFLFGHQDADAYGVDWKSEEGRSDVKEVCGAYPAVHGWDIGKVLGKEHNIDGVLYENIIRWIKEVYKRGGVNTISWHWGNPVTKGSSWDQTPAIKSILPGGSAHGDFLEQLDQLAKFFNRCKAGPFTKIPIIFRPWHEHNGDWFWWGKGNCSEEEYVRLWQFTVHYLRDEKKIHHLIYAFSPDRSRLDSTTTEGSYLYAYPGDAYVDLLGLDNYMDVGANWNLLSPEEQQKSFVRSLTMVTQLAEEKGKVAALTETGLEGIKDPDWFTRVILQPIKAHNIPLAYVLVWRNANNVHHYAPYPGHPSAGDFIKFYQDERTLFENDVKDIYK